MIFLSIENLTRGMLSDFTCIPEAEPGKLDIKRHKPAILFIGLQADLLFKLAILMKVSRFVSINVIGDVI